MLASLVRPSTAFVCNPSAFGRCTTSLLNRSYSRSADLDDDGLPKDYKLKTLKAGSRRLDTFVNRSSGKSSSQVEKLLLGGRIRVNDENCTKKSYNVSRDDTVDIWIGPYKENNQLAEVERVEIVDYEITDKGYDFTVKSWKKFLVENWRGGSS